MGTHPIFESDFDCLTDMEFLKELQTVSLAEQTADLEKKIRVRESVRKSQQRKWVGESDSAEGKVTSLVDSLAALAEQRKPLLLQLDLPLTTKDAKELTNQEQQFAATQVTTTAEIGRIEQSTANNSATLRNKFEKLSGVKLELTTDGQLIATNESAVPIDTSCDIHSAFYHLMAK